MKGDAVSSEVDPADMVVIRFYQIFRRALPNALLVGLFPLTVSSACWDIEMPYQTVTASAIWQIRNRISAEATLLGESNGKLLGIPVERVESLAIRAGNESGWLSGSRKSTHMEIRLIDDRTVTFTSGMALYYQVGDKRHAVQPRNIVSIVRCVDDAPADAPRPETAVSKQPIPLVGMKNGDRLHGQVASDKIRWQTLYAKIEFEPDDISLIYIDCNIASRGTLETRAGDFLNGSFADIAISIRLINEQIIEIPTDRIHMINFIGTESSDRVTAKACSTEF